MRSKVLRYYAMGLLAIVISLNAMQIWHNGWAHAPECEQQEVQQHSSANADCLLCSLFFAATSTALSVLSILLIATIFIAAIWQTQTIAVTLIFGQPHRGPPALMA